MFVALASRFLSRCLSRCSFGLALVATLAIIVLPSVSAAQQVWPIPQPEEEKKEEPPPPPPAETPAQPAPTAPTTPAEKPDEPGGLFEDDPFKDIGADVLSSYAVRQGQIGIGAGLTPSLNLTGTFQLNNVIAGQSPVGGAGTYVLAMSPQFSYFPISRVEVGGFVGPILRHRLRANTGPIPWPELAGTIGGFAAFHYPVTDGVLLIGTAGGAPLVGASGALDTSGAGGGVDLSIILGGYVFARAGAGYMFNRNFQVRVEGEASVIGDLEIPTGSSGGFSLSSMANTGVRLSLHGYF